jgi:hypothetical protein
MITERMEGAPSNQLSVDPEERPEGASRIQGISVEGEERQHTLVKPPGTGRDFPTPGETGATQGFGDVKVGVSLLSLPATCRR